VGDLVGIKVLDHIVLGDGGTFRSLADDGVLGGAR
jgi:DNA repair protein RadC